MRGGMSEREREKGKAGARRSFLGRSDPSKKTPPGSGSASRVPLQPITEVQERGVERMPLQLV